MRTKETSFVGFVKALPKNMFSGLVVSLIALPLGLGLAMASEAPPIAGVITAIVGGVIVSVLGGSFVTISGPGNGLVGRCFSSDYNAWTDRNVRRNHLLWNVS